MMKLPFFQTKLIYSSVAIFLTGAVCFMLIREYPWKGIDGKGYTRIIDSDGKGYYKYLPNIFIRKNITHQAPDYRYIFEVSQRGVNRYYAGTALAMLPFFGLGYAMAYIEDETIDGYSPPFQKAISFAGLFYLLAGLIFLKKFLSLYNTRDITIAAVVIFISFGTNLLTYSVLAPSMSHIYSFCFITAFLYFTKKLIVTENIRCFFIACFILGIIILIRPINILIIFSIPFLTGSPIHFTNTFLLVSKLKYLLAGSLILFLTISIQPLLWFIQSGEIIIWSYQNEGFYFSHPQVWNVLFSFRKGLFVYTPLLFISLFSHFEIARKSKFQFFAIAFFLLIIIYFISSWWNWYYGPSFGQRPFVEYYGLFALLLAFLLNKFNRYHKIIYAISFFCLYLNLIQNYQYQVGIFSAWDMNFNKYKYIFLKTSPEFINCLGGNNDIMPYKAGKQLIFQVNNDFEKGYVNCNTSFTKVDSVTKSIVCDYSSRDFNTSINVPVDNSFVTQRELFAEVSLDRFELEPYSCTNAKFVLDISNAAGENYYYYSFPVNEIPTKNTGTWKTFKYSIDIPRLKSTNDKMMIYIWNIKKQSFYIDNLSVKIYNIQ